LQAIPPAIKIKHLLMPAISINFIPIASNKVIIGDILSQLISWRLPNKQISDDFKKWVKEKHGKKRGAVGDELSKAMKFWIETDGNPQGKEKTSIGKKQTKDKIEKIVQSLEEEYTQGAVVERNILESKVASLGGLTDQRAINGKITRLEGDKVIQTNQDNTVTIFPERYSGDNLTIRNIGEIYLPQEIKEKILNDECSLFIDLDPRNQPGTQFKINNTDFMITKKTEIHKNEIRDKIINALGYEDYPANNRHLNELYNNNIAKDGAIIYINEFKKL